MITMRLDPLAGIALSLFSLLILPACGREDVELAGGDGGSALRSDGGVPADGGGVYRCEPQPAQCSNCKDDDGDGLRDGDDPECISSDDDDEATFATGIAGDNVDAVKQDCFFDGNSGSGNDGCELHICCIVPTQACYAAHGTPPPGACDNPDARENCTPGVDCCGDLGAPETPGWVNCAAITPPGCDCFGCCTVCRDGLCKDIPLSAVNSAYFVCDSSADLPSCPECVKSTACHGGGCVLSDDDCVLCPGQTAADLPARCNGVPSCPLGVTPCVDGGCPDGKFCSSGCCIYQVE
jgi:hypothetical protein